VYGIVLTHGWAAFDALCGISHDEERNRPLPGLPAPCKVLAGLD